MCALKAAAVMMQGTDLVGSGSYPCPGFLSWTIGCAVAMYTVILSDSNILNIGIRDEEAAKQGQ